MTSGRGAEAEPSAPEGDWDDADAWIEQSDDDAPPPAPDPIGLDEALQAVVTALHGQHRDGQAQMAAAVARSLAGGGHLLVQAGTGTGKSVAYLVPAILHATSATRRVVVATATLALQHQLVHRDLPRVVEALTPVLGRRPTYAVLKGRHNYVCLDRLNQTAADADEEQAALFAAPSTALGRQAKALRTWADTTDTGDRDDLPDAVDGRVWRAVSVSGRECVGAQRCPYGESCFAERARDRARAAQVVVTNHAMLAIHATGDVPVLPEHDAVVVDEGHELAERATSAVTRDLAPGAVERAASRARAFLDDDAYDLLVAAGEDLMVALAATAEGRLTTLPEQLALVLVSLRAAASRAAGDLGGSANREAAKDGERAAALTRAKGAVAEVLEVTEDLLGLDESAVAWVSAGERRPPVLHLAPLTVAPLLRTRVFDATPTVVTSATLTLGGSFASVARSYGLDAGQSGWTGIDVGSPFDHARQGILYVASRVPPPGRDGVSEAALAELADLVGAAGGRTLALLSSWRGVDRAASYLADHLPDRFLDRGIVPTDVPVLVQKRGDSVADLVRRFADEPRSVLLGTLSLWQGVDVPGDACTLVVIDRIPFPRPDDPIVSARAQAADQAGGNGFVDVSVPRAALMLAQGVGRLIRSSQDRGVVAVLDPRLATARYGGFLRASLPPFWYSTDGAAVRAALTRLDERATH